MNTTQSQFRFAPRAVAGFTLIELMVTLAVIAITLSIGVPSFQGIVSDNRMSGAANNLIGAMNVARSEAIKRGRSVNVTASSGDWSNGGSVIVQPRLGTTDAAETIRRFDATTGMTISGSSTTYSFLPSGFFSLAAAEAITICDAARTGETGRKITVSTSGRMAVSHVTCS